MHLTVSESKPAAISSCILLLFLFFSASSSFNSFSVSIACMACSYKAFPYIVYGIVLSLGSI